MSATRKRLTAIGVVVATGAVALLGSAGAPAESPTPPKSITPAGVGAVKLGARYTTLRRAGLVGRIRPGCELGGPNTRSARLRVPLVGSVDLTTTIPRRVRTISIRGGLAVARDGVGIGARRADIRRAFPRAVFDRGTEEVFGITLVKIPRGGGGRIQMALDTETRRVTQIGVPGIPFCE